MTYTCIWKRQLTRINDRIHRLLVYFRRVSRQNMIVSRTSRCNSHTWMRMNVSRDVWMLAFIVHMFTLDVHLCRISYEYEYVTWHMWMIAPVDHMTTVGVCSCDIRIHRAYEYVTSHVWISINMSRDNINDLDRWLHVYFRRVFCAMWMRRVHGNFTSHIYMHMNTSRDTCKWSHPWTKCLL